MFLQSNNSDEWKGHNDKELWTAFKNGKRKALSTLFLRYYEVLLRYGIKLIDDRQATKDGIQKLFLRLWEKKDNIESANSVKFYLLLSLRRILLRQKNKDVSRQQRNQEYVDTQLRLIQNIEMKIIAFEVEKEREKLYQKALNTLTNRQEEILFLRLHHGMKNKEIAKLTGLTHQRVRNYMSEAVSKLKEYIFDAKLSG